LDKVVEGDDLKQMIKKVTINKTVNRIRVIRQEKIKINIKATKETQIER